MTADTPDKDTLLAYLRRLGASIGAGQEDLDGLYAERVATFVALRAAGVTHREIAEAAGVTEVACINAIKKWGARKEAEAAT